eukprot:gb/GFBE01056928.1/.p1 GENE.gb/GFBE01056928.1/~~gb/GFBE01056928.1/.p1  ORF type:complete len:393 (+),score=47.60 gb/GFBE01056928.1/:1-1179(+)
MGFASRRALPCVAVAALGCCVEVALANVDCSKSPNCTQLRRQPCNVRGTIPNACGKCLPGAYGGRGPINTVCLSRSACAAIHPGEETCHHEPGAGKATPFIVPFERCVCDDGSGRYWPTAPGMCARVLVTFPAGSSYFEVQQCSTRTCDPASCTPLATWPPDLTHRANNISFSCEQMGDDAIQIYDDCNEVTRRQTPAALCNHAGFAATSTVFDALGQAPVDCELAPRCPASVLTTTRMQQSCCQGTLWSNKITSSGEVSDETAPGFCPMVFGQAGTAVADNTSNASNSTTTEPYECLVRTIAPGWTGCACMDADGFTHSGRTCTVTCEEPLCGLSEGGIRPVPIAWLSSEVKHTLLIDHAKTGISSAERLKAFLLVWIAGVASIARHFLEY